MISKWHLGDVLRKFLKSKGCYHPNKYSYKTYIGNDVPAERVESVMVSQEGGQRREEILYIFSFTNVRLGDLTNNLSLDDLEFFDSSSSGPFVNWRVKYISTGEKFLKCL